MPVTGALSASPVGWPATFYLYGALGLLWCVLWLLFGASSPKSSRWISKEECKWIESQFGDDNREVLKCLYILLFYVKLGL